MLHRPEGVPATTGRGCLVEPADHVFSTSQAITRLIDSLPTYVGLCLPDGTLVRVNRATLTAAGLGADEAEPILGVPLWDAYWCRWHPDVSDRMRRAVAQVRSGRTIRCDEEIMTITGTVTVDMQFVPVIEDGEVTAIVLSATDVTARRRSVEQALGLAALARKLNAAPTAEEVADVILSHTTGALGGRHATLALLDPTTRAIRLLQSPGLPEEVARQYHELSPDSPNHIARCIRSARRVVLADPVTADDLEGSREELARLRRARAAARVAVTAATPLFDADGLAFGALAVGWPRIDDLDEERQALLDTVAELSAQAIERARFSDAHAAAARRSQALAALSQELASAITVDAVWGAVARRAPNVVGACTVALGILDEDAEALEIRAPGPLLVSGPPLPSRLSVFACHPQADAARTGEPVFLPDIAEHERRYPVRPDGHRVRAHDTVATAALPLRDNADRVTGALTFTWNQPIDFDPLLCSALDTVAELCGQTLERARLHAAEHELVESLQLRLLRPIPSVPSLTTHAIYRAAQTTVGIGGDFHDGLVLPGERLAVVLGDVTGHGMEAAADMAQLRTLISTLLAAGTPLAQLFPQADAVLEQLGSLSLATAVAAVIDPAEHTLSYVYAGHPPLVLRRPDGTTASLHGARGGLLGAGIAGGEPVTVPFEPGSVLVGYTDGLVERRGGCLDDGIAALVTATAATADADPALEAERIAAVLLERCVGEQNLTDDVALLVVTSPDPRATTK